MGGGHHHDHFKIPDWRQYKVEGCPELMQVQQSLQRVGLKDPWLRNEVWRYDPKNGPNKYSVTQKFMRCMFRGFPLAVGLLVATIAAEKAFGIDWHDPRGLHKGHGHGGHGEEHH